MQATRCNRRSWLSPWPRFVAVTAFCLLPALSTHAFEDAFDGVFTLEETASPGTSASAAWWLNSGGRLFFANGTVRTFQGAVPSSDRWFQEYARSSPGDTDGGTHPQNLLRLLTQQAGAIFRQSVSVRVLGTNLSASPQRDRFSGVFLYSRFIDEGNSYVAGVRFDGQAVIKKEVNRIVHTLAIVPLFPGVYDRVTNPTLLPQNHWFSLRTTITDVPGGVRILLEVHDPALSPHWIRAVEVIDGPGGADGVPFVVGGRAGIRADFMDLEFDDYTAFVRPDLVEEFPGHRDEESARVVLKSVQTPQTPPDEFGFGAGRDGSSPIAGRWDAASCGQRIGFYVPATSTFFLDLDDTGGIAEAVFAFGPAGRDWLPIAGDWNGDGLDTVGLYDPQTGSFFLQNRLVGGVADVAFAFGPPGLGFLPIAGDWDGDGQDTVGLYDPATGNFFLINRFAGGAADIPLTFGPGGDGVLPITGDWNGDGVDTIGLFRPGDGVFALRNFHAGGLADRIDVLQGSTAQSSPVAGRFEDACR